MQEAEGATTVIRTETRLTGLAARFSETHGLRTRRALIDVVARRPDMTLEQLAALVADHPELHGMTLDDLLADLRQHRGLHPPRDDAPDQSGHIVLTETEVERLAEILDQETPRRPVFARHLRTSRILTVNRHDSGGRQWARLARGSEARKAIRSRTSVFPTHRRSRPRDGRPHEVAPTTAVAAGESLDSEGIDFAVAPLTANSWGQPSLGRERLCVGNTDVREWVLDVRPFSAINNDVLAPPWRI